MLTPILDKEESVFRNEKIFAVDYKTITLENVLVNLFMLMRNNGKRIKLKLNRGYFHSIESLHNYFNKLEQTGVITGYSNNKEALETWLRCSLINMVYRGNASKENVSSLRPMHLECYRIRNTKHTRDYNAADQVFMMLSQQPAVMDSLKKYLSVGWDTQRNSIVGSKQLDVDTAGILHMMKLVNIDIDAKGAKNTVSGSPLLIEQSNLFCEDVKRLLAYQEIIPRSVFIEYLNIIIGFHISLYFFKIVYLLPKMIESGSVEDDGTWSILVDASGKLTSDVAPLACADMESKLNGLMEYIRATFKIDAVQRYVSNSASDTVANIIDLMKNPPEDFDVIFKQRLKDIYSRYKGDDAQENKEGLDEYLKYEPTNFDKYIQCIMKSRSTYHYTFAFRFLDSVAMKNKESAFLADGRSRKTPRRAVLGTKLLEVLVQLLVLSPKDGGGYESKPLSIDELARQLRSRYGLIVDGTKEEKYHNAEIDTQIAFKSNMEALKNKLRQIGFYADMSDAAILQKIRPRYTI